MLTDTKVRSNGSANGDAKHAPSTAAADDSLSSFDFKLGPMVSTITIYSFFPAFFMFVFGTTASIVYAAADRSLCDPPIIAFFIGCIALGFIYVLFYSYILSGPPLKGCTSVIMIALVISLCVTITGWAIFGAGVLPGESTACRDSSFGRMSVALVVVFGLGGIGLAVILLTGAFGCGKYYNYSLLRSTTQLNASGSGSGGADIDSAPAPAPVPPAPVHIIKPTTAIAVKPAPPAPAPAPAPAPEPAQPAPAPTPAPAPAPVVSVAATAPAAATVVAATATAAAPAPATAATAGTEPDAEIEL